MDVLGVPGSWCGVPGGSWGVLLRAPGGYLGAPWVLLGGLWGFELVDFFDVVQASRFQTVLMCSLGVIGVPGRSQA